MAAKRVLLIHNTGPLRDALARVLAREGHDVQVVDVGQARDRLAELGTGAVVCGERRLLDLAAEPQVRWIELGRPVDMEELRRALREA